MAHYCSHRTKVLAHVSSPKRGGTDCRSRPLPTKTEEFLKGNLHNSNLCVCLSILRNSFTISKTFRVEKTMTSSFPNDTDNHQQRSMPSYYYRRRTLMNNFCSEQIANQERTMKFNVVIDRIITKILSSFLFTVRHNHTFYSEY